MDKQTKNSVLIVDDDETNIISLKLILDSDYTVYTANNGMDGVKLAEKYLPNVILLDILMPEMNGHDVLAALKNSEKTQDISVIFVTTLDCPIEEEKGLALGAIDYITKPFVPNIVKLRVQNQISLINQMHMIIEKELAEKSSRTKLEFLSRMSHDMLTPMNVIMGMTHILKRSYSTAETREYLDEIEKASKDLLGFIKHSLEISGEIDANKGM